MNLVACLVGVELVGLFLSAVTVRAVRLLGKSCERSLARTP
jgi:hypothetical protein